MNGLRFFFFFNNIDWEGELRRPLQITPTSPASVSNEKRHPNLPLILVEQYKYSTGSIIIS